MTHRPMDETPVASGLLARLAAIMAAAVGIIAFSGWVFGLPVLKSVLPGAVEMKANTAVGLVLAGCALFILADRPSPALQRVAQVLALAVGVLGLATLGQYLLGWQLGIDELLFRDTAAAYNAFRGRMSPYSAVAFAAIGAALAALPRPGLRPLTASAAFVMTAVGALSFLGYLWNAGELVTDVLLPPVAVHTALAFIGLGAGTLLATRRGVSRQGRQPSTASAVERRFLAGLVGALLLLTLAGGLTYRGSVEFTASAQRVSHVQEVRGALRLLYGNVADAESAQRNYLITGQLQQLENHRHLASKTTENEDRIARLVADNPDQLQNLAELKRLTSRVFGLLEQGIALYQHQGFPAARDLVASGQSISGMEAVSALIERMDAVEGELLAEREAALTRARQGTLVSLLLTLAVATIIFAVLYRGVRREMASRSKAEQALIVARVAADTANRAKSAFLATMSHEIRTPINGVLGMIELLSLSSLGAEQRTTLEVVQESSKSLLRIIDDILDFSKVEAGKLEIRPEVASIKDAIDGVHKLYLGSASSKGLLVKRSVDPRISPALWVDPVRLRQILNNFVSNALKFTFEGGIEIKADLVERVRREERVRFTVTDTGIGISPENQQHLFQPFVQAEGDTARRFGGTGLGLTICRRLAEMMGGSVAMESELGKGTTMILTLSLPIADPRDLPKADRQGTRELLTTTTRMRRMAPSVAQAEAERTLLLLVDDHPTNRLLLTRQVQALGYAAESAENGRKALEMWKSGRFGIVISDCNMPEMDGYELARNIRRLESADGGGRTPIIACTANALGGEAEMCFAAGMDDYLAKPAELKDLLRKLDQWLPIPVTANAAAAPLERSVLAAISGGDAHAERDILINFRRANDEDAATLEQAVAQGDIPLVARATHRIKGASRMVGAMELASVCENIERASRGNDWSTVKSHMGAFQREWTRLNTYLTHFERAR